ncbi:Serine/threonine protein kinase [Spathaspora passalidarum NRRL Y-27907]|uniref:Serine/threonine protein kinase n=1 Tax=Spathaspora passalidarum (strain NRRL Y-27907 / 11-Y1) TaxID=619300 RepID=G3AF27_SPAPN|nr:Serine/threonine protein kinase [Spathaspora passalidarum NRRL Y-27907]EGW34831.1 Serine/threonine protein kinase [Spathaspora passalidarum NRRL Y-27907]
MTLDVLSFQDPHPAMHQQQQYITSQQQVKRQQHSQRPNPNMVLDGYMLSPELRFIKKIGAGTYGLIYLVENITTGRRYAAKMLLKQPPFKQGDPKDSSGNKKIIQQHFYQYFLTNPMPEPTPVNLEYIRQDQSHQYQFMTEIQLHLKVHHHPNVITIHQVYELQEFAIVILLDYFEQGDLFGNIIDRQIFQNHTGDKQLLMKNAMLQLIDAVEYCHQQSVYHCDLKPENIMIHYNPNYKRPDNSCIIDYNELHLVLIDFGLAMSSDLICCNACRGSSFYMAPERTTNFNTHRVVRNLVDLSQYHSIEINNTTVNESNSKYLPTLAGDIWSLGVLFINITCSRNPWPIASFNNSHNDVFKSYILNNNKDILASILPISKQFNRLLDRIFQLNPNDRISLPQLYQEVIKCNFFKDTPSHHANTAPTTTTIHARRHTVVPESIPKPTHKVNEQLYTPPETTRYNSYVSDEEENIDDDAYEYQEPHQEPELQNHKYYYQEQQPPASQIYAHVPKFNLETPSNSVVYLE